MIWFVILTLLFQVRSIACAETAKTTECFVKKIGREEFNFRISSIDQSVPIEFSASLVRGPDLPSWMKITQKSLYDDAFLYGTPDSSVLDGFNRKRSLKIHVVAKNTETYETSTIKLTIKVVPRKVPAVYETEVVIRNLDISDVLEDRKRTDLLRRFRRLWNNTDHLYYTKISSLLDEGGRVPLPDQEGHFGRDGDVKNGVLVRIGSRHRFTDELRYVRVNTTTYWTSACRPDHTDTGRTGLDDVRDSVSIDNRFYPTYRVDWCRFKLITKHHPTGGTGATASARKTKPTLRSQYFERDDKFVDSLLVLEKESVVEFPEVEHVQKRDYLPDIILCLLLPLLILIVLIVLLTCLFFCYREGKSKRDTETPPVEMKQYRTIHHVSDSLRSMSNNRDNRPVSDTSSNLDTSGPAASTPSRTESAPPPYSTPSPQQGAASHSPSAAETPT